MSTHIGAGYGSEFHLMRVMGRYRNECKKKEEIGWHTLFWDVAKPAMES